MVMYLFASCGSLAALRPWLLSLVAAETCRVSQVGCWGFRRQELCVGWGGAQNSHQDLEHVTRKKR